MRTATICIPLNATGGVAPVLGQAPAVVVCRVDDGAVTAWTEHPVRWDTTYGVDVPGVHHPRVVRFMLEHEVSDVVVDTVCDSVQRALDSKGVRVHTSHLGDARRAVDAFASAA